MVKWEERKMDEVICQLSNVNKKLDTIILIMEKPENKLVRMFEIVAMGVGILGILTVIDVIRNWLIRL
jgi:hypothetical protein